MRSRKHNVRKPWTPSHCQQVQTQRWLSITMASTIRRSSNVYRFWKPIPSLPDPTRTSAALTGKKECDQRPSEPFKKAVTYSGRGSLYMAELAHAYAVVGRREDALALLQELNERARKRYVSPYGFALVCTGIGNKDQAFAWLDKAYEERASALPFLNTNPTLANLRSDFRFHALLQRMNLEP
jgi:tetratricopeptide (TPR) repeat protein